MRFGGWLLFCAIAVAAVLLATPAQAPWAAEPGITERNAFGPASGLQANTCRGACGGGCPRSCERTVSFECTGDARLRRVVGYDCGTHTACRNHDECLDACVRDTSGSQSRDCQARCDAAVVEAHGPIAAAAWLAGQGPYDGRILYEYSREAPDALEAAYQCPAGTTRQCDSPAAACIASNGERYEPLFAAYPQALVGAMQVSSFRSGMVCDDHVCTYAIDIPVTGKDDCAGQPCTRFGVEFDYRDADPTAALECRTSTLGEESDFINTLLKQGADSMISRRGAEQDDAQNGQQDGAEALTGLLAKMLASGDSTEDIDVTITPLDKDGNPIESQRVGSRAGNSVPPVPRTITLPASSGHLLIPMYQSADAMASGAVKEKHVMCSHRGSPVLEATFRLQAR